ncbi:MAG TPA: hypothetical protein VGM54_19465 [Chthoniobacter sp.]|jgi:hypothetical protein
MPNITLQLADHRTAFAPREKVSGKVTWQLDKTPERGELRLMWRTSGRGNGDYATAETIPFPDPQASETRPFTITLPEGPYSFSGTLITLTWTIEAAFQPGNIAEGVDIVLAPNGKAVSLPKVK